MTDSQLINHIIRRLDSALESLGVVDGIKSIKLSRRAFDIFIHQFVDNPVLPTSAFYPKEGHRRSMCFQGILIEEES